ncbi:uncharacterized protein [Rutidosis leptorrhynchoides]|uniref:uncharacterized protein n=1 Tax=Rutidosis leptorrhynchoides TaxID=125765 RepID=UPI003A98E579
MRLASWNTRGLGNGLRGRMAGSLVNRCQLQFLTIQETMVKLVSQTTLKEIWKYYAFDSVEMEASGRSRGLLSIWRLDFFSLIQSWSRKHWIATILRYLPNNQVVLIVTVYDPHIEHKKQFVWSQLANMEGPLGKFSRIDRVLINNKWALLWPDVILQSSLQDRSDHKPIIWAKVLPNWGPKPYRFNNTWFSKLGFIRFCENIWSEYNVDGWAAYKISKKLRLLKSDLKIWSSSFQDKDESNLKLVEFKIKALKKSFQLHDLSSMELLELVDLKKIKKTTHCMSINNQWVDDPVSVKEFAVSYFENLFAPIHSLSLLIDIDWASLNLAQIPAHLIHTIESQFSNGEILSVIEGFDGNKNSGSDGFSLQFFKKSWHFLKDNIMEVFNQFHDHPSLPKGFNSSFIVLIPKTNCARVIEQMRPISLINAPYKILAKTLANRLKLVIPSIISENQNGFVPSRLLLDGVMVVNEVVHMEKSKKKPLILIKIDFSKAYDCNIWFSVLLNGSPSREASLQCGLRQGDPLSSFLFIIIAEVLSKLLSRDLNNGFLEGCKFGNNLVINHSQFADDTIIFAQPNARELNHIKYTMGLFFQLSGLQMNSIKTTMYGIHVSKEDMISFSAIFDCKVGSFPMEYLGIPISLTSNRVAMWDLIVKKFKKKLAGWKGRCLSFGGRLVMVNAVLSNLPLHYMAIYKAPVAIIKQLERHRRNFLWGGDCLTKKTCLVKWDTVCLPKDLGGLGVTPLRIKNLTMLCKWWARFNSSKPCLWKSIVSSSFGSSFQGKLTNNVSSLLVAQLSPIWRDLINLQHDNSLLDIIGPNVWKWKLGNGACTLFGTIFGLFHSYNPLFPSNSNWVFHLIHPLSYYNSKREEELRLLLSHVVFNESSDDHVVWSVSSNNSYSVSDAIRILVQSNAVIAPSWPKVVWGNNVPSKVMLFHWLAIRNSIPVKDVLLKRHILPSTQSNLCVWCLEESETTNHLLLHCKWSFKVWAELFA